MDRGSARPASGARPTAGLAAAAPPSSASSSSAPSRCWTPPATSCGATPSWPAPWLPTPGRTTPPTCARWPASATKLSRGGAETFREAVQALWFLFALLHLESNASSFSPGRADQYLHPYLRADLAAGRLDLAGALELVEALWLKFNQVVYLRNSHSAAFFAGFPIGFNVAFGGKDHAGNDCSNELSYLFLKAQDHIALPQPNLSARLHENTPDELLDECTRVIGLGSGMPQAFNDESVIPALERAGDRPRARGRLRHRRLRRAHHPRQQPGVERRRHVQPGEGAGAGHQRRQVPALRQAARAADRDRWSTSRTFEQVEKAFAAQIDFFFEKMIAVLREGGGGPPAAPADRAPLLGDRRLLRQGARRHPRRRPLQPLRHPGHPACQRGRQPGRPEDAGLRGRHGEEGPAAPGPAHRLRPGRGAAPDPAQQGAQVRQRRRSGSTPSPTGGSATSPTSSPGGSTTAAAATTPASTP